MTRRDRVRQLVLGLAGQIQGPPAGDGFPAAQLWARVQKLAPAPRCHQLMRLGHWLWPHAKDLDLLLRLVSRASRARNAYAYFHPIGPTLELIRGLVAEERAEREQRAHREADRAFFKGDHDHEDDVC